jgi:hypothetical protein
LSDVIRSYRNLIHPGRAIRLAETVDEHSAVVAVALVEMISKDVGKSRAEAQGYTAEQLYTKIDRDPSAVPIAKHLLGDMSPAERERLLLRVIPSRCLDPIRAGEADGISQSMGALYRVTYESSLADLQKRATEAFVRVLREEPETVVAPYESAFFRGSDLEHLAKAKQTLVKAHILARIKAKRSVELLEALKGISRFLTFQELNQLVDAIVTQIAYGSVSALDTAARELLANVYQYQTTKADDVMVKRLEEWVELLRTKGHPSALAIDALRAQYGASTELDDLPF